jgi:hypothetical protein
MASIKLGAFESFITRSSSNHFVQATESRESKTVTLRWFLIDDIYITLQENGSVG